MGPVKKVETINLENGFPTAEEAIRKLEIALITFKRLGRKAVIVIHGYGSTGKGGKIKTGVKRCLNSPKMVGIVRRHAGGEEWFTRKSEILKMCQGLEKHEKHIRDNEGLTVVIIG